MLEPGDFTSAFSRWQTVWLTFPPGKALGPLRHPGGALRDALATELNSSHLTSGLFPGEKNLRKEKSLDMP